MSKQGEWKAGNWYPHNPKGSNQFKKIIPIEPTEQQLKQEAKEIYIQLWKKRNELKSLAQRYSFLTRKIIGIEDKDLK